MRRPPSPTGYTPVDRGEPIEPGYLYRNKYDPEGRSWLKVDTGMLPNVFFTSRIHTDLWFVKPVKEAAHA